MGCSPFKGTLQRLIDAVDANGSGMVMVGQWWVTGQAIGVGDLMVFGTYPLVI